MAQRKRKGNVAKSGGGNTMFYVVLGVIAIGGLVAIGYALRGGGGGTAATELVEIDAADARALYDQATPVHLGEATAPVKVIEFGDYQCPACGDFSLQTKPFIVDRYVTTGQVQFTFYDFPLVSLHNHAVIAARAARCAGAQELPTPERLRNVPGDVNAGYWVYHDKLFQEQADWAYTQGSVVNEFIGYAADVGLDRDEFAQCLNSDRFADVVSANRLLAEQLRLSGTPTVIVNNQRIENWRPQNLSGVIEEALGAAAEPQEGAGE